MADYMDLHQRKLNRNDPNKDNYKNDMLKARKNRIVQNQSKECCESKEIHHQMMIY